MAVTKIFAQRVSYNMLADTTEGINTSGYKSAKVVVKVDTPTAGTMEFNVRDENGVYIPLVSETLGERQSISLDYRGGTFEHEFLIDLSKTNSCRVMYSLSQTFAATSASIKVYFSYDAMPSIHKADILDPYGKGYIEFEPKGELFRATLYTDETMLTNPQIVVNGTEDGEEWSGNINYVYNEINNNIFTLTKGVEYVLWMNTQNYKKIRIKCNNNFYQHVGITCNIEHLSAFERTVKAASTNNKFTVLGGGRYMKLTFKDFTVNNGTGSVRVFAKNDAGEYISPTIYTLDGKPIIKNTAYDVTYDDGSSNKALYIMVEGDTLNGGLILKYDEPFTSESQINYSFGSAKIITSGETPTYTKNMFVTISDKPFAPVESVEDLVVSRNAYNIYNVNIEGKIVDACNEDLLIRTGANTFKYCRYGLYGLIYDVVLDAEHCPSLITGENVKFARLMKYENSSFGFSRTRILLFTDKNRILYNRPKNDYIGISYFREAPLYNTKKRFYPVNSKSAASDVAKYLPIYPDYDYNQFNGRVGGTDAFGLSLPTRGTTVGTLLEDWRQTDLLNKVAYSTIVMSDSYGCIFGNYGHANADPWVAVSSNGKEFYIVETWASVEDFSISGITTMRVDLSTIISNAGGYTSGSLKLTRRKYNVPSSANKNPSTPFIIGDSCVVSSITVTDGHTYVSFVDDSAFTSDEMTLHRFNTMSPIVFFENISANSEYNYICNAVKADGSDNTGIFFRLHRVSSNNYELIGDCGDPFEGDKVCRHIHSVSETYGGFLVATGENYRHIRTEPFFDGGFIYLMAADAKFAAKPLQYTLSDVNTYFFGTYRLQSSELGINRACGAVMRGDKKIVFVSDSVQGDRNVNAISIEGRTDTFGTKSYGVYMGDVEDCDDWSLYKNVCNMYVAGLGLVEHMGRLAVCAYAGPIHISPDYGETWYTENIGRRYRDNPEVGSILDVTGLLNDGSIFYGNNRIEWKE